MPDGTEFAARIIGALGQLMVDYHARDLAVQNAVSELTSSPTTTGLNLADLQHIDLVTQTHADLARFLPRLAEGLRSTGGADPSLAGSLTLRSLQDVLLNPAQDDAASQVDPGEMDLF